MQQDANSGDNGTRTPEKAIIDKSSCFPLGSSEFGPLPLAVHQPVTTRDRILALFEIFACSGVLSSAVATGVLTLFLDFTLDKFLENPKVVVVYLLLESALLISLIVSFQKGIRHQRLRDLGFKRRSLRRNIMIGLLTIPGLFLISDLVGLYFKLFLPEHFMTKNPLLEGIKTPLDLVLFIVAGVVVGGFKEELQRAFILLRFEKYLLGAPLGLVLWSVAFGAGHYAQGFQGTIVTGMLGFCFGLLFLWRRSIVGPIIAHAGFDVLALLGFWFLGRAA